MPRLSSRNQFVARLLSGDCFRHDRQAGAVMCPDGEAGALYATTVKQELLSQRL